MSNSSYWRKYWKTRTCGEHRSQAEHFLAKEAKEKLFHLNGGKSLLDFGCGSADLLAYYSQKYELSVGVDFSEQMLERAKMRLAKFKTGQDVLLINSDDSQVWDVLASHLNSQCRFDRITAGQVIQYLDHRQIESFVCKAVKHLSADGLVCLFDIVDSRTYELWNAKLFKNENFNLIVLFYLVWGRLNAISNKFRSKIPEFNIGYRYSPLFFESLANKHGLKLHVVNSMYYEYRYHVIISCQS